MKYIVSDEYKFVYFVVQKAACSSIKTALLPLFDIDTSGYEITLWDGTPAYRVHKLFDNSSYQLKRDQLTSELDDEYRDYFKFAFVRNPWDRLVSCYCEKVVGRDAGLKLHLEDKTIQTHKDMSFAEFVEAVYRVPDERANSHFMSQHRVICEEKGQEVIVDYVGHFESLEKDFSYVAEMIGGQNLRLPHILRSRYRDARSYAEFYDEDSKELVRERYLRDIEMFGYSF